MNHKTIGASPHKTRTKKAFTMVEMMLVVVVIGLLFTLLVSNMDFSGVKAKTAAVKADIMVIQLGLHDIASTDSGFPDSIELLSEKLNKMGLEKVDTHVEVDNATNLQYLDAGRTDPWGHPYRIYLCNAGDGTSTAAVICAGVDGTYMSEDDLGSSVSYLADGMYGRVTSDEIEGEPIHAIGGWKIEVAATCSTPGKKVPICGICGLVMSDHPVDIPAEHQIITVDGSPATCTSDGTTSAQVCSVCGTTISAASSIPMLPHNFTPWQLTSQGSTCIWVRRCTVCNTTEWGTTDSPLTPPPTEQAIPGEDTPSLPDVPVTPPSIYPTTGDRIAMNLDGETKFYYVITVSGSKATVMAPATGNRTAGGPTFQWGYGATNQFAEGPLDTFLNEVYYEKLTSAAQAAIVDCLVEQEAWKLTPTIEGTTSYVKRHALTEAGHTTGDYLVVDKNMETTVRHIRTLSMRDLMICCRISYGGEISASVLRDMIGVGQNAWLINPYNCNDLTSNKMLAISTTASANALVVGVTTTATTYTVFPVFDIDLSKIDFTKS